MTMLWLCRFTFMTAAMPLPATFILFLFLLRRLAILSEAAGAAAVAPEEVLEVAAGCSVEGGGAARSLPALLFLSLARM